MLCIFNTLFFHYMKQTIYWLWKGEGVINCYFFHQMPLLRGGKGQTNTQHSLNTRKDYILTEYLA
jgi:hypothetical protein